MLGGAQFCETLFIIATRRWIAALGCAIPLVGLLSLFRKIRHPFHHGDQRIMLATMLQNYFIWCALVKPLMTIIQAMGSTPGS